MTRNARYLCYVVLAQVACVALGLWMHYRYTMAAVADDESERVWADLAQAGGLVASQLWDSPRDGQQSDDRAVGERLHERMRSVHLPDGYGVALVGPGLRITTSVPAANKDGVPAADLPPRISWTPAPEQAEHPAGATAVVLDVGGKKRAGLLYNLAGQRERLLVYARREPLAGAGESIGRVLPAVSAMACLWTCALLGITVYMILSRFHDEVQRKTADAEALALRRIETLVRTRDAVIFGLAKLAESRDPETGSHLDRISVYSQALCSALQSHPRFRDTVTPSFVRLIGISSVLHDIGKVGIEDRILRKPGLLTDAERKQMQRHTIIGGECLLEIEQRLGSSNFLQMAREIAFAHHEHWDGSGYPKGLKGEAIPLCARIVAIADVYDALSTKRIYKDAYPHERCVQIIHDGAGTHFDPNLVEVWLTITDRFRDIAWRYADVLHAEADAPDPEAAVRPQPAEHEAPAAARAT